MRPHELRPAPAYRGGDALGVQPVVAPPELLRAVVHVLVGDAEHLQLDARATLVQKLRNGGTEATRDDVLLDGDETRRARGEREKPFGIERLREARVHHGGLQPFTREDLSGLDRGVHRLPVCQDHDVIAFAQRLGDADGDLARRRRTRRRRNGPAREADADGAALGRGVTVSVHSMSRSSASSFGAMSVKPGSGRRYAMS